MQHTLFAIAITALAGTLAAVSPTPRPAAASPDVATLPALMPPQDGVRCPSGYTAQWNSSTQVLRCSRANTTWVLTVCADPMYSTYNQQAGRDDCRRTQAPGIGNPVASGTRAISCAAPGYTIKNDATGTRDRCERTETQWAYPHQL
jgi:hypothetical protein